MGIVKCPKCSSPKVALIAPGFYRCEAIIDHGDEDEGYCGYEFQDGRGGMATTQLCASEARQSD